MAGGYGAEHVAIELNRALANESVYCDSIEWDGFWLDVLFGSCGVTQSFELCDVSALIESKDRALMLYTQIKENLIQTKQYQLHRAKDDAELIWKALNLARII